MVLDSDGNCVKKAFARPRCPAFRGCHLEGKESLSALECRLSV
jgi:hypothetical protein